MIEAIQSVLTKSPQSGFWKCYYRLRFQGYSFNHKRVYRRLSRISVTNGNRISVSSPTTLNLRSALSGTAPTAGQHSEMYYCGF